MVCKGVLDITDVNATDVSGSDMHLFLENPLLDQTGRWAGRPFRVLSVVTPGTGFPDVDRSVSEKQRFIENLWRVQARFRTRSGQSVATVGDEFEVDSRGGRVTMARVYYNIYTRTPFLQDPKKVSTYFNSPARCLLTFGRRKSSYISIPLGMPILCLLDWMHLHML